MPDSRSRWVSSGQMASCRRLYSSTLPGLSFMRNAWFIAASIRGWRWMRGVVNPGVGGNVLRETREQLRVAVAQPRDDHARQRVRAVLVVMRPVAPLVGEGARGALRAQRLVEAPAHVIEIDESDTFFAGDVPDGLGIVREAVHDVALRVEIAPLRRRDQQRGRAAAPHLR